MIKKPQSVNLDQYYGEYSYLGTTLKENMIEPQPSLSDVKQLVTLYGILPLGKHRPSAAAIQKYLKETSFFGFLTY